jgi:peptidyl-prolyl cis-trans isomerase C
VLVLLARCAPAPSEHARAQGAVSVGGAAERASSVLFVEDASDRDAAAPSSERARVQNSPACPLSFADSDVELARVGGAAITACDVALVALVSLREGGAPLTAREALARAVLEATFAREAEARAGLIDEASRDRLNRTLADAVVREAARRVFVAPSRAEIERYLAAHRADFDREPRVHVRAIAVESEARARAIVRELQAGAAFEHLAAERSVLGGARRDEGDLGLSTAEGNELVPRAVAQRAFALTEFGAIDPEPVRVEVQERVGRRRRVRTRVRWFVVQRLERTEAEPATVESAARRIAFRLGSSSWREALQRQRGEVLERARAVDSVTIDERALRSVSIQSAPAGGASPRTSRSRTHRVAAPRRR